MRPDAGPCSQLRQGPSPPTQCESSGDPSFRTKPSLQELTSEVSSRLSPRCPPQQTAIPESQQQPLRGHRQSPRPACPSWFTKGWRTGFLELLGTYFFRPLRLWARLSGGHQAGLSYSATQPLVGATVAPPLSLLYIKCELLSRVQLLATPWTGSCQASRLLLSVGFSRWEYWSRLPCPPPGDLPNPGMKPKSPALQADSLPSDHQGSLYIRPVFERLECHPLGLIVFQSQSLFLVPTSQLPVYWPVTWWAEGAVTKGAGALPNSLTSERN